MREELVRIDSRGEAHAIGTLASQRLRGRVGTFRLLPSPEHIVFMRYTGEDGRRDGEDGAVVRLAGEVTAPGALCDVLALLAQTGWRGELVVEDSSASRSVFFEHGNVVGASTSLEQERLGAVLYRYGALAQAELERVARVVETGRRFGEVAVELGVLTQKQIYQHIEKQIEEIVLSTLMVNDGTFFFLDGFNETRLPARHIVSANTLLMGAVTRMDELSYFREKVPSSLHVPVKQDGRTVTDPELVRVYEAIDGRSSIEDIGRRTGLGEFETTKQIYALLRSKQVAIRPPRPSGGPPALVMAANGALAAILAAADAADRGADVRRSLSGFAVGAGVYDILFRAAGPDEKGQFDPKTVAENAMLVAAEEESEQLLKQALYEYLSFALFSAGAVLGLEREAELKREVAPVLEQLRPACDPFPQALSMGPRIP
ncbi:MAG TPA: DUF4388 domain-containing protein [Polyangiaceae bacterium]